MVMLTMSIENKTYPKMSEREYTPVLQNSNLNLTPKRDILLRDLSDLLKVKFQSVSESK